MSKNYHALAAAGFARARTEAGRQEGIDKKLPQPIFAAKLNALTGRRTSASQISEYESGRVVLPAGLLVAAAELVDMTVDQLISEGDPGAQYQMLQELLERVERLESGR